MNPNICNHCGDEFISRHGKWICRSCGSPKPETITNEEVTLLYTAYQKLRLAEFSEAEQAFDDIIRKYPEDPNGYWGRLMARYGIKYEQDFDGRMIPTCYATSIESLSSASDYKKALQYADAENRAFYKKQAEYIERVRKEWVEKAQKEKPYDIFICYKESDLVCGIERTQDSIAAQDLYVHLTGKGYRVFYSHESLRDKVGEKYEPYIFNALATAKVMIVYGSTPEYITSTWLKNEWTRYEKRIQNGEKKPNSLIVACDGFSPGELPSVLSSMQCMDAKEKSFYSDLDEAVEKIIYGDTLVNIREAKRKKRKPFVITVLLLTFAIMAGLAAYFLRPIAYVSDSRYGSTVRAHYGSFAWNTTLHVESLSVDGKWKDIVETLHVDTEGSRLYQMILRNGEAAMEWEGDLTVSIPLPRDVSAARATVYDLSGAIPQKIKFEISDGKIVFTTNRLGTYLITKREHNVVIDAAVEPTCTEKGYTEGSHCADCNEVLTEQREIPALGHKEGSAATCTEAQFCTVCSAELISALGHTPGKEATCTQAQTCTVCSLELVSALGHMPGKEATCTEAQSCIRCETELSPAKGHGYVSSSVAPTCSEDGYTLYACTCGDFYKQDYVPALGHTPGEEATCMAAQTCTVCNAVLKPTLGHTPGKEATCTEAQLCTVCNGVVTPALGHTPNTAICTEPQTCTVCYAVLRPAREHAYVSEVTVPTCTSDGYTTYTCRCGDTYTDGYVSAIGHRPGKEATCTQAQICTVCTAVLQKAYGHKPGAEATCTESQICTVCMETLTPALGHTPNGEATCTEAQICSVCLIELKAAFGHITDGEVTCTESRVCTVCNETLPAYGHRPNESTLCTEVGICTVCNEVLKEAFAHTPGEWVLEKEPTKTETGLRVRKCTVCGGIAEEKRIAALGSQGFTYSVNADRKTCKITGIGTCTDKDVVIPATIDGYTVTRIANSAFAGGLLSKCKITSIVIPDSVTKIDDGAFRNCDTLVNVVLGSGVTIIGESAFYDCDALVHIEIPEGVTVIEKNTFYGCDSLASVVIGNGVTRIKNYAFYKCASLKEIAIPESVTRIDHYVFQHCDSLESVIIGKNVTKLGQYIFQNCDSLKTVIIEDGLTSIGKYVFYKCKGLQNIVIPDSITEIGNYAFYGCENLRALELPDGLKKIGNYAFYGCDGLTTLRIGGGMEKIGRLAFSDCDGLTELVIENGAKRIAGRAFMNCKSLKKITLPESLTRIGEYAFASCKELREIRYGGTTEQWAGKTMIFGIKTNRKIRYGMGWDYETNAYTVYCTDGFVSKTGGITVY